MLNHFLWVSCLFSFFPGMRLGRCLQAADGPRARSEELPRLPRKRWLSGHHGDLSPPSTSRSPSRPDAALHRLSGRSKLPWSRLSGGHSQPDRQLDRSQRAKHRVPLWARWRCEDNSARGLRRSPVFSRNLSEGKTTKRPETHSNGLIDD